MNQIKERLQKDYNLAVVFFNDKDYESFFVHIRPHPLNLSVSLLFWMQSVITRKDMMSLKVIK